MLGAPACLFSGGTLMEIAQYPQEAKLGVGGGDDGLPMTLPKSSVSQTLRVVLGPVTKHATLGQS